MTFRHRHRYVFCNEAWLVILDAVALVALAAIVLWAFWGVR